MKGPKEIFAQCLQLVSYTGSVAPRKILQNRSCRRPIETFHRKELTVLVLLSLEEWILFAIINLPDLHNQLDAWGIDGEVIQVKMPSKDEVSKLVSTSEKQYNIQMESARHIPDLEKVSGHKGIVKLSRTPIELKSSAWNLKVVPGVGGRIISMEHLPSVLSSGFRISHGEVVLGTRSEGLKLDSKLVLHQPRQSGRQYKLPHTHTHA